MHTHRHIHRHTHRYTHTHTHSHFLPLCKSSTHYTHKNLNKMYEFSTSIIKPVLSYSSVSLIVLFCRWGLCFAAHYKILDKHFSEHKQQKSTRKQEIVRYADDFSKSEPKFILVQSLHACNSATTTLKRSPSAVCICVATTHRRSPRSFL